jgi:hypothetical protein
MWILGAWSFAGTLSQLDNNSTFLEANFIHYRIHQVDATAVNRPNPFWSRRVRDIINVESFSFVLYSD